MTQSNLNQQIEDWLRSRIAACQSDDRPFITLAYAQSWDGSITTRCGDTVSFSGDESMQVTHQLRSLHDGILIGVGTLLSDDPQLTVREWDGANPQPIVLDSQLRTPATAKLCSHPDKQCWVLTVNNEPHSLGDNVDVLIVSGDEADPQQVPLGEAMQLLRQRGIKSLMVEGGAEIITAFLQARLVDALVLTVAPKLVGGYKAVDNLQSAGSNTILEINPIYSGHAGRDLVMWGDLQYADKPANEN